MWVHHMSPPTCVDTHRPWRVLRVELGPAEAVEQVPMVEVTGIHVAGQMRVDLLK